MEFAKIHGNILQTIASQVQLDDFKEDIVKTEPLEDEQCVVNSYLDVILELLKIKT